MICSRRLYKGNSYEICLPLKYSGVTGVNIYTDGAVKIPVTPEISGDTLCFEITSEDLDVLADGVLRYELITDSEVSDSNSRFVVKTPDGYSAQTLDNLLEEAYQSGYTAGGEGGFESGYTSGYTDGYDSGFTDGYDSKICKDEYSGLPLTFEIISGGTINWKTNVTGDTTAIDYRKNGGDWTSITSSQEGTEISVEAGDKVEFRGNNSAYATFRWYNTFCGSTAVFEAYGNIMSLISKTGYTSATTMGVGYALACLFKDCTGITSAENLIFPATTLTNYCYSSMFDNCTNLTTAPEILPATNLATACYSSMFAHCTNLSTAPALPATTLADFCYTSMFAQCTSLTTAPALPATTLQTSCYYDMFNGCTSMTTAPSVLPATTLATRCYYYMFNGCSSLTTAPELPATTLADSCYSCMFQGCSSMTTAPALPATTLTDSCYSQMFYDCTGLTTAPELPATILTNMCYNNLFGGCTSLNYVKCLATDISADYCTLQWLRNVSPTGTFVKNPNMTSWTTGYKGIPSGWTVQDAS